MATVVNQSIPVPPSVDTAVTSVTLATSAAVTEGITFAKRSTDRSDNLYFLFIPLAVLVTIMLLSVVVYLMARRRHKIRSKYSYVPSFSFESSDMEEDREDRETDHLLKGGKLRLDEPLIESSAAAGRTTRGYEGSPELFA